MTEQWQELKETITEMRDNDGTGTQQDACKFLANYMEVLEKQMQEPCEDCISRQQALDCFEQTNTRRGAKYAIETLPSVTPKYTDEEIDRAQAVEQAYVDKMVELAVEETKRPNGKWIIVDDCEHFIAKCSECGEIVDSRMINNYPYCHCGAEMEVEE